VQIKRFEADNITQALKAVKAEFGADAVILETRRVGGGGKAGVQVTAAWEPAGAPAGRDAAAGRPARRALAALPAEAPPGVVDPPWAREASRTPKATRAGQDAAGAPVAAGGTATLTLSEVQSALVPLREELSAVGAELKARTGAEGLARLGGELAALRAMVSDLVLDRRAAALPEAARSAYETLADRGLPRDLAAELAEAAPDGNPSRLEAALAERVPVAGPLLKERGPRRVLFAGPTGVGKTTTIAKLAAHYAVTEKRSVALVTLDTFRIGAVEQVSTYARIIGIPCAVAADRAELAARLKEFARHDLVLIDTAGRSPKDADHVPGLARVRPEGVEVQLVLPATRPVADHRAILAAYAPLAPAALVLTKLDEAQGLGAALHTALTAGMPVSYLTDGQRIPEDLQLASGARLAARFLAGEGR